jgi:hypothetical protein
MVEEPHTEKEIPMISLTQNMETGSLVGSKAAFPVALRDVQYVTPEGNTVAVPKRKAVVNLDSGEALSVVSDRYELVTHAEVLGAVERTLQRIGLGDTPRGIHVDKGGARFRALYKIESRKFDIGNGKRDELCPMIRITNSYAADSRVVMELGAFRFVCTNALVGGGGVFAAGFRAIHAGEINADATAEQMGDIIERFPELSETFRAWRDMAWSPRLADEVVENLEGAAKVHKSEITKGWASRAIGNVWKAYNVATEYATHRTRTAGVAYDLLRRVNNAFTEIPFN